jgi:polysaccharide biosynthesis/export protein
LKFQYYLFVFALILGTTSCRTYRQNVLFRTAESINFNKLESEALVAQQNYKITKGDRLRVEVYTNKGERIIDPDFELMEGMNMNQMQRRTSPEYLVEENGLVKLPMVGNVSIDGLTLREAEKLLEKEYDNHYKSPFVIVRYLNKRVVILGAAGGMVVPLENENTNLIEILALAGGIPNNAKGHNIRLIRGDLNNPEVQIIDLTTIEGMRRASLKVQSGDIIYVEPIRRVIVESVRDIGPVLGLVANVLTLFFVLQNVRR